MATSCFTKYKKQHSTLYKDRVKELVMDGKFHTNFEIREAGGPEGMRVFRLVRKELKAEGWKSERKKENKGIWNYRLIPPGEVQKTEIKRSHKDLFNKLYSPKMNDIMERFRKAIK